MYDPEEHGVEVIRFGNWVVTTEGMAWGGPEGPPYFIAKNRLWETRPGPDNVWDWLIHLTEKTWLSDGDIYQLNTAFFFAQDYHAGAKPEGAGGASTSETLKMQRDYMKTR